MFQNIHKKFGNKFIFRSSFRYFTTTRSLNRLDPYYVLGIDRNANSQEIKTAYKQLVLKWHPDKHPVEVQKEACRKFQEISEAYEILKNEQTRENYKYQTQNNDSYYSGSASAGTHYDSSRYQYRPKYRNSIQDRGLKVTLRVWTVIIVTSTIMFLYSYFEERYYTQKGDVFVECFFNPLTQRHERLTEEMRKSGFYFIKRKPSSLVYETTFHPDKIYYHQPAGAPRIKKANSN